MEFDVAFITFLVFIIFWPAWVAAARKVLPFITTKAWQERKRLEGEIDGIVEREEIACNAQKDGLPEADRRKLVNGIILDYLRSVKTHKEYERAMNVLDNLSDWDLSAKDREAIKTKSKICPAGFKTTLTP